MKRIKKELLLDRKGVDAAAREIAIWLKDLELSRKDRIRIRLTMEELLLRISEHFGGKITGSLFLGKRFGVPEIRFRYRAEAFNPVRAADDQENEMLEWTDRILANMALSPSWSYRSGLNTLSHTITIPGHSSQLHLIAALVLAVLLGIAGPVIPVQIRAAVSDFVLFPVSELFTRLLNTFLGPMVFFSIMVGICGIGNASNFGRIGKQMVIRYLLFTLLGCGVALPAAGPFFDLAGRGGFSGDSQLLSIRDLLLDIIPSNPVRPFYDGNTLQIIFMSAMLGILLLSSGDSGAKVRDLVSDLSGIMTEAICTVCRLLPLFILASFTLQIWESGIKALAGLWKPVVLFAGICAVLVLIKFSYVCVRLRVKPLILFRKIFPSMIVGFSTASSSAAYSVCTEVNEKKLGIDPILTQIGYPVGCSIYSIGDAILFVVSALYLGEKYGIGGGAGWMLTLWITCTVLSYAVPPVTGGNMACIGILIRQIGFPGQSMAVAGLLALVLDFVSTGFSLGLRHLELILQAEHLGMLDHDVLRE